MNKPSRHNISMIIMALGVALLFGWCVKDALR